MPEDVQLNVSCQHNISCLSFHYLNSLDDPLYNKAGLTGQIPIGKGM